MTRWTLIRALVEHPACYETDLKPMSWLQRQSMYQPIPFGLRQYWKGHFVGRLMNVRQSCTPACGRVVSAYAAEW